MLYVASESRECLPLSPSACRRRRLRLGAVRKAQVLKSGLIDGLPDHFFGDVVPRAVPILYLASCIPETCVSVARVPPVDELFDLEWSPSDVRLQVSPLVSDAQCSQGGSDLRDVVVGRSFDVGRQHVPVAQVVVSEFELICDDVVPSVIPEFELVCDDVVRPFVPEVFEFDAESKLVDWAPDDRAGISALHFTVRAAGDERTCYPATSTSVLRKEAKPHSCTPWLFASARGRSAVSFRVAVSFQARSWPSHVGLGQKVCLDIFAELPPRIVGEALESFAELNDPTDHGFTYDGFPLSDFCGVFDGAPHDDKDDEDDYDVEEQCMEEDDDDDVAVSGADCLASMSAVGGVALAGVAGDDVAVVSAAVSCRIAALAPDLNVYADGCEDGSSIMPVRAGLADGTSLTDLSPVLRNVSVAGQNIRAAVVSLPGMERFRAIKRAEAEVAQLNLKMIRHDLFRVTCSFDAPHASWELRRSWLSIALLQAFEYECNNSLWKFVQALDENWTGEGFYEYVAYGPEPRLEALGAISREWFAD